MQTEAGRTTAKQRNSCKPCSPAASTGAAPQTSQQKRLELRPKRWQLRIRLLGIRGHRRRIKLHCRLRRHVHVGCLMTTQQLDASRLPSVRASSCPGRACANCRKRPLMLVPIWQSVCNSIGTLGGADRERMRIQTRPHECGGTWDV